MRKLISSLPLWACFSIFMSSAFIGDVFSADSLIDSPLQALTSIPKEARDITIETNQVRCMNNLNMAEWNFDLAESALKQAALKTATDSSAIESLVPGEGATNIFQLDQVGGVDPSAIVSTWKAMANPVGAIQSTVGGAGPSANMLSPALTDMGCGYVDVTFVCQYQSASSNSPGLDPVNPGSWWDTFEQVGEIASPLVPTTKKSEEECLVEAQDSWNAFVWKSLNCTDDEAFQARPVFSCAKMRSAGGCGGNLEGMSVPILDPLPPGFASSTKISQVCPVTCNSCLSAAGVMAPNGTELPFVGDLGAFPGTSPLYDSSTMGPMVAASECYTYFPLKSFDGPILDGFESTVAAGKGPTDEGQCIQECVDIITRGERYCGGFIFDSSTRVCTYLNFGQLGLGKFTEMTAGASNSDPVGGTYFLDIECMDSRGSLPLVPPDSSCYEFHKFAGWTSTLDQSLDLSPGSSPVDANKCVDKCISLRTQGNLCAGFTYEPPSTCKFIGDAQRSYGSLEETAWENSTATNKDLFGSYFLDVPCLVHTGKCHTFYQYKAIHNADFAPKAIDGTVDVGDGQTPGNPLADDECVDKCLELRLRGHNCVGFNYGPPGYCYLIDGDVIDKGIYQDQSMWTYLKNDNKVSFGVYLLDLPCLGNKYSHPECLTFFQHKSWNTDYLDIQVPAPAAKAQCVSACKESYLQHPQGQGCAGFVFTSSKSCSFFNDTGRLVGQLKAEPTWASSADSFADQFGSYLIDTACIRAKITTTPAPTTTTLAPTTTAAKAPTQTTAAPQVVVPTTVTSATTTAPTTTRAEKRTTTPLVASVDAPTLTARLMDVDFDRLMSDSDYNEVMTRFFKSAVSDELSVAVWSVLIQNWRRGSAIVEFKIGGKGLNQTQLAEMWKGSVKKENSHLSKYFEVDREFCASFPCPYSPTVKSGGIPTPDEVPIEAADGGAELMPPWAWGTLGGGIALCIVVGALFIWKVKSQKTHDLSVTSTSVAPSTRTPRGNDQKAEPHNVTPRNPRHFEEDFTPLSGWSPRALAEIAAGSHSPSGSFPEKYAP